LSGADVDIRMDITNIPLLNGSCGAIYCSHVLEHVPDDRKALREFKRVLAPQGWALLCVPITADVTFEDPSITSPQERLRLFGQDDHVRRYGPDFNNRLQEAGFMVEKIAPQDLSSHEVTTMGLTNAGEVFLCK
jgi:ubiquinone/menaquinone biosynthesis C-methylase UbiE